MRILITGANGFLGSNIIDKLLQSNHSVIGISQKNNNLIDISNSNFIFQQNIGTNYNKIKNDIINYNPEVIIHTAWFGGNNYDDVNNLEQYTINLEMGLNLLDLIKEINSNCMFIGFGSFAEYGILTEKAKETQQDNPNTHYGLSKSSFKNISKLFCDQNNINWTWIRPCYVYGHNDVSTRLIPKVIKKLKNKEKIVLDSCNVTIDYLHVKDFCLGVENIIDNKLTGIYNVCSGKEYSLREILNYLQSIDGFDLISYDPLLDRKHTSKYICGSSEKLQSETDWIPKKEIYTELEKIYNDKHKI